MVEANIRYLPLYPDDEGIIFNEEFLTKSKNILSDIIPNFEHLSNVVRVIDVPASTNGENLQVLMNAITDEVVGILAESTEID